VWRYRFGLKKEKCFDSSHQDVRWVIRENLKKRRLERMDAAWVLVSREKMGMV